MMSGWVRIGPKLSPPARAPQPLEMLVTRTTGLTVAAESVVNPAVRSDFQAGTDAARPRGEAGGLFAVPHEDHDGRVGQLRQPRLVRAGPQQACGDVEVASPAVVAAHHRNAQVDVVSRRPEQPAFVLPHCDELRPRPRHRIQADRLGLRQPRLLLQHRSDVDGLTWRRPGEPSRCGMNGQQHVVHGPAITRGVLWRERGVRAREEKDHRATRRVPHGLPPGAALDQDDGAEAEAARG